VLLFWENRQILADFCVELGQDVFELFKHSHSLNFLFGDHFTANLARASQVVNILQGSPSLRQRIVLDCLVPSRI